MEDIFEQMQMDMTLRDYSPKTIESYTWHIRDMSAYFERSLSELIQDDIRKYLYHLKTDKGYSNTYLSQAYSAIKYLYRHHFDVPIGLRELHGPRASLKLPVVLSREEIGRLFSVVTNQKHKLIFMVIYSGGLRVSEAVGLQVKDIDSRRMQIKVRQGKGRKDRYTLLSGHVLERLREYWRSSHPKLWLFPSRSNNNKPLSTSTIQRVFQVSRAKADINESSTVHSLRHSFATHLLEQGVNLFVIQRLLGHKHIQNTLIYLHLQKNHTEQIVNPIDALMEV
jgi:integrase/recombinase XerD